MDKPNFKKLMRLSIQALTNFPYIEEDFDALTNYELLCKVVGELNKVSDNQKTLDNNITLLIEAFNELKNYVDNYFENLDVQEEINNKLDEMAESGQLTDIIAQYLGLAGVLAFNTVADMKTAVNLVNGSTCRTLGFYELNDGGSATYKIRTITNEDIVDEMFIIALSDNTLIAELVIENGEVNSIQIGCKINDETFDNGNKFNGLFNKANNDGFNVKILQGDYYVDTPIVINEKLYAITISGISPASNENGTRLVYTGIGYCLTLQKGGLKYTLENLTVLCNNENNGILCNGTINTIINFKNYLRNITVTSAVIGMKVIATTYTFIDNYTFGGSSNTEVGLEIDGYEFTYIKNSSIDGYSNTDENSIALKINGGLNFYIDNMDLCNFGLGKAIYLTNNVYNLYAVYFNNINIVRCDGGIVTETGSNGSINSISYDNLHIALSGTNENSHYFYAIKHDSYGIQNISIENVTIRNLASTSLPDYFYEQNTGGVYDVKINIKDSYNCPIKTQGIKGGNYDRCFYQNNLIKSDGMVYINTDGTSTQYSFEISYPNFTNQHFINVFVRGHNDYIISDTSYDTTTGNLSVTITFDTAPTAGNIRIGYNISNYGAQA